MNDKGPRSAIEALCVVFTDPVGNGRIAYFFPLWMTMLPPRMAVQGSASSPQFSDYFHVQSNGSDLIYHWNGCDCGCMGLFPRVLYWDQDNRKDLITGTADGYIILFLNIATDENPSFDGGAYLQVGPPGSNGVGEK